jgi:spermidine/putrescine transport system ATP-binding protein
MAPEPVVRLERLSKRFPGGIVGLDGVDLAIEPGEFLSLLGPSGCGKTTSLRVIAGFEQPTEGRVLIDGRDVTALKPYHRPVNTVFQDYALFPHMSVAENVGFGLSLKRLMTTDIRRKVAGALDMVGLADKIDARVQALSGGQRQRVALARAIVCEPRVLLLDEPLSALDAHLREQMQVELKRLQGELGTTFVMVTHDQTEALSISDRIAVMNLGRIEQIASPATLYDEPATRFVASFIGTMNVLDCRIAGREADEILVSAGALAFRAALRPGATVGEAIAVGVRPEDVVVETSPGEATAAARLTGTVFHGRALRLHAALEDGTALTIDAPRRSLGRAAFAVGDVVHLKVRPGTAKALSA